MMQGEKIAVTKRQVLPVLLSLRQSWDLSCLFHFSCLPFSNQVPFALNSAPLTVSRFPFTQLINLKLVSHHAPLSRAAMMVVTFYLTMNCVVQIYIQRFNCFSIEHRNINIGLYCFAFQVLETRGKYIKITYTIHRSDCMTPQSQINNVGLLQTTQAII